MPDPLFVIDELRDYLVTQGVGVDFYGTPSDTLPGIARAPKDGAPDPVDPWPATVTLRPTGTASQSPMEPWWESTAVEVVVRAKHAAAGQLIQRTIRGLIVPLDKPGGRKDWTMGNLNVYCSFQWRNESPIPVPQSLEQRDLNTYDTVQAFMFECSRRDLAGT